MIPRQDASRERGRGRAFAGAVAVAIVASVLIVFAYVARQGACDFAGCHRDALYDVQLAVACTGLIPVVALLWAMGSGRRRTGVVALLLTIGCYALWGVLYNRAVHG